ncbi:MAG: sugar transferase [Candidatus Omnitrophota bacterium]|nr:sugar transferase [Candidatus Omnitrophota bacterium]
MVKRIFDLILALVLIVLLSIPMLAIAVFIKLMQNRGRKIGDASIFLEPSVTRKIETSPVLFWTDRVGVNNAIFKMAKFRTMKLNTPQVATHLMENPERYLIPGGEFLRKYSLDELPQLFNVLKGDMSFVGPRPALFNQDDLIALRTKKNIHTLTPGVTGWAQVNGRDDLAILEKVAFDEYYLKHRSFVFDLYIILLTAIKVVRREGVRH